MEQCVRISDSELVMLFSKTTFNERSRKIFDKLHDNLFYPHFGSKDQISLQPYLSHRGVNCFSNTNKKLHLEVENKYLKITIWKPTKMFFLL